MICKSLHSFVIYIFHTIQTILEAFSYTSVGFVSTMVGTK